MLQTPNSPPPIAAVPLAVANTPPTAPLDKGKKVLTISSEDEDLDVRPAYKRRRTNRIVYSRSPSPPHGGSLMNNPPSTTSPSPFPSPQTVQEEGVVEFVPLPIPTPTPAAPTPTPELMDIPPHQAADQGFQREANEEARKRLHDAGKLTLSSSVRWRLSNLKSPILK